MAENENEEVIEPSFPNGRVKKIMKIDKDINKVNAEALHSSHFLAERSAEVAIEKKRKIVKLDHLRAAVKRHRPTSDFLLDSLPAHSQRQWMVLLRRAVCGRIRSSRLLLVRGVLIRFLPKSGKEAADVVIET
ncbi:unnamed protein product [Rhodiola kirilowii]